MRDKKVRILFVINSLAGGGAERVLSYILKGLNRNKFEISLITFLEKKDYVIPTDVEHYSFSKKNYFDLFRIILELAKVFRSGKYDLIVSFLTYTNIFVIISWFLAGGKIPLIISERCNPKDNLKNQKFATIKIKLVSFLYPLSDVIVVVSQGVKKNLISKFKILSEKIKVIYNPLDLKKIDTLKKEEVVHVCFEESIPIIVACGRLTAQKNFSLLIKALKKLIDKKIKAKLVILGRGEEKGKLEKLVNNMNLENEVAFLGFQKNPYKYMSKATIFVLSSSWEGFPNVLLEAMACGVPVISTNCPYGPSEIIEHGKNGFLVPVDDEKKLANAMEKLLKDAKLREAFSREGRKFVESQFRLERIIKEWEKSFLEVAK